MTHIEVWFPNEDGTEELIQVDVRWTMLDAIQNMDPFQ